MEEAILVGLDLEKDQNFENSMLELANLATACNITVLHTITQKSKRPTANYYIGSGKVKEVLEAITTLDANLVIFNDELSPSHIRNLEEQLNIKVIDRTVLILDIFARRAKTKEAMLQVELAQAKYFMPRVIGMHKHLSRQKSGTGSKGPGEQQLELDRRLLRNKITKLQGDLDSLVQVRRTQREKRKNNDIFTVALTGYTNSGKSTLMNSIIDIATTHKEEYVFEKNMLFATLETKTKRIHLDNNHIFLLTDTVGFIEKLPHHLIEAFKSTLEEISEASLILHVIDTSNKDYENQIKTVEEVLESIGVSEIPIVYVYNKVDLLEEIPLTIKDKSVFISAINNYNVNRLLETIDKFIYKTISVVTMLLPFNRSEIYAELKETSNILNTEYTEEGTTIQVEVNEYHLSKYKEFIK
ncbi:MAG: GTPase HflX [Tenericutes bacterium]|nr:GTPase HflX [Mycoplasmatota bacterium]